MVLGVVRPRGRPGVAVAALGVALTADALLGEPPARAHPVVWLGTAIGALTRRGPREPRSAFLYGAGVACGVPAAAALAGLAVARGAERLPGPLAALCIGLALKPAFAARALLHAGEAVERALCTGDLEAARCEVHALVSRDPTLLGEALIAAAAIESLAENLGDSVAGPLLAYAAFGLPGAWAYRALNTLDSMVGYRGEFEWLGKASARLDDVVSAIPARAAAAALALAAAVFGYSPQGAIRTAWRDHPATESPNAGWPMAVAAGALGVRLEKVGHYVLNAGGSPPAADDIAAARRMSAAGACVLAAVAAGVTLALRQRGGRG